MLSLPPPSPLPPPPYPPSSSSSRHEYDVFLSFRGEDTRKTFTDHLFAALKRNGIHTFRDDPMLEAGEEIAPELFEAIQASWCSVIVFSKTYPFSSWCLEELVEIVEQRKKRGHRIFPIFYDVDPSHLRKQTRKVEKAFAKHEERYKEDKDKIQRWRKALTEVANLSGWHLKNKHESEYIRDIVTKISEKLSLTYAVVPDGLIGIKSRLEDLHSKIDIGEDDVRIIGICGMGGLGKTTLARVVYSQMSPKFESKSFLADVREVSEKHGLVFLQKQLLTDIFLGEGFNLFNNVYDGIVMIRHRLSHKKVLVVIDDVDNLDHLRCLVGGRNWFGPGSRIIITTRDEKLLRSHIVDATYSGKVGIDDVYKPAILDFHEAQELFNLKAFNTYTMPENDFEELSLQVVKYAGGLPLALEVLGSFFCLKDASKWRDAIERLQSEPEEDIFGRLRIGFDGLTVTEKNIFLDIACFFNMEEKDFVIKILEGCEFFPKTGIDALVEKSLIQVVDNKYLRMHDLLQEMGRQIVKQKSPSEPGKRCRLWEEKEVYHVLTRNTATETIEGIVMNKHNAGISMYMEQDKMCTWIVDALPKMKKLRLLRVSSYFYKHKSRVDLKYLSNDLRLLDWKGYPFRSLPSSFQPDNLVALLITDSHIERLWEENRSLSKLKLVNLKGSTNLIETPDFTRAPDLESLTLEGCTRIVDVHLGDQSKLKLLNLRGCKSLKGLSTGRMDSLETLILSGCSNLQRFLGMISEMKNLQEIYVDETHIKVLPSMTHLSKLKILSLRDCKSLRSLPVEIIEMESLEKLILSGCSKLQKFPKSDKELKCLQELYLDGTGIEELPSSIRHLSSLVLLNLKDCSNLTNLPSSIGGCKFLKKLILSGCSKVETLPENLRQIETLEELDLSGTAIRKPPFFIFEFKNLQILSFSGCRGPPSKVRSNLLSLFKVAERESMDSVALILHSFSSLSSLRELDLSYCNLGDGAIPSDISGLSSLEKLDLVGNNFTSLPANLGELSKLDQLYLSDCKKLKSLPRLLTSTEYVYIRGCASLEVIEDPIIASSSKKQPQYFGAFISYLKCYKLAEKNNASTMLIKYIKIFAKAKQRFRLHVPGSEIPEWFRHQTDECTIKIPLPPNIGNDSQWMGVAHCYVLVSAFNVYDAWEHASNDDHSTDLSISRDKGCFPSESYDMKNFLPKGIGKGHLFVDYFPRESLFQHRSGETDIFEYRIFAGSYFKLKRGFRIVYEEDLEEMEGIKEQCCSLEETEEIKEQCCSPASENFDDREWWCPCKALEKILNFICGINY